jgi:hypothetical protein
VGPGKQKEKKGLVWRNRKKISQIIKDILLLKVLPLNYFMTKYQEDNWHTET